MTQNSDLKAVIRSRMEKTGESYTQARRHVLANCRSGTKETAASAPFPGDVRLWLLDGDGQCNLPEILHKGYADEVCVFWGYAGSGPQDLALSILAAYFPGTEVPLFYGKTCSQLAHSLHLGFLEDFLLRLPEAGGVITQAEVRAWVAREAKRQVPRTRVDWKAYRPGEDEPTGESEVG